MAVAGTLLVLAPASLEAAHSAELRYLDAFRALQARRVFARVDQAAWDGRVSASGADAVLLLASPNVLVMAPTLAAMRRRLDEGAGAVFPHLLADFAGDAREPLHTLGQFEALEADFLVSQAGRPTGHVPSPPVVMVSPGAFADLTGRRQGFAPDALRDLSPEEWKRLGVAFVGLAHDFVDYYGEPREDVIRFIPPRAKEVLEVGCARGVTGRLLQERLGCRVTGVELNPVVAREAARVLHRVICGDFESVEIDGTFDVVLATELLEHLVDPSSFFARARRLLGKGGRIVLSTPNTGHYSIVEALLAGRWDYLPIGLQCVTHVRFFTASTLRDWLGMAGFGRYELVPQTTALPERFRTLSHSFAIDEASLGTSGFYVLVDL